MRMSGGFQIEIPSFDEDEDLANVITPMPHGHTRPFFEPESPVIPQQADESPSSVGRPFRGHSRGGSSASESSAYSVNYRSSGKSRPIGHSSTSSVATTATTPSKKSSFASLKAAMRSVRAFADSTERVPPVPALELNYPALKNPFANPRPQSPALSLKSKKRPNLTRVRSRPSYSTTTATDQSSSEKWHMHASALSPAQAAEYMGRDPDAVPPVPRIPREHDLRHQQASSSLFADMVNEPKTPSEFALHVVFMRFVAHVELRITEILSVPLEKDPSLTSLLGPNADPTLDSLLDSLGHIAQRHANLVAESVMRWRKTQSEPVDTTTIKRVLAVSTGRNWSIRDASSILNERKGWSSIYILSRSLIVLIRSMGKEGLGEATASSLEKGIFDQFETSDPRILARSPNRRANAALYAELLGAMAESRFTNVTDRFLDILVTIPNEQLHPDNEQRFEHLVRGMRYIRVKVWPPEAFEQGAEFMESLSGAFVNAHGFGLKTAFAETLTQMLHPIRKTVQAEVNNPLWAKAMQTIYPRALAMMVKPRYWYSSYPLAVTSLCVAPTEFFLKHWMACFELSVSKMKDKATRPLALNGMARLIWTYLYRCPEPGSTAVKTLDGCLRALFPPARQATYAADEPPDIFIYILHVTFSRHFEQGRDLILDFMNEQALSGNAASVPTVSTPALLAPDKMIIAIRAAVLTLRALDADTTPPWPDSSDFTTWSMPEEYSSSGVHLSETALSKGGVREFLDRLAPLVGKVAAICERLVGEMFVSDERFSVSRQAPTYEDREFLVLIPTGSRMVAYRKDLVPYIDLLRACFDSWPACWNRSIRLSTVLDVLVTGVAHVDHSLGNAASDAIRRFASSADGSVSIVSQVTRLLFSPDTILKIDPSVQPMCEHLPMVELWAELVETWAAKLDLAEKEPSDAAGKTVTQLIEDVEAGSLFLLCSTVKQLRLLGVQALRAVASLPDKYQPEPKGQSEPFRLAAALDGSVGRSLYEQEARRSYSVEDEHRLARWTHLNSPQCVLRLIEEADTDRFLWRYVFPPFLRVCLEVRPRTVTAFRNTLAAAVTRVHSMISGFAGITSKTSTHTKAPSTHPTDTDPGQMSNQWVSWVTVLAATCIPTDPVSAMKEHARHGSDPAPPQERLITPRGLIRLVIPYLGADVRSVREGMVHALGCVHPRALRPVLEDTYPLTRHIHEEGRKASDSGRGREKDRLQISVMHIFQLTADLVQRPLPDRHLIVPLMLSNFHGTLSFFRDPLARRDAALHSLRRYFCGFIEQLFDALSTSAIADSGSLEADARLLAFQFCEEWCNYPDNVSHPGEAARVALCDAAARAMASLCVDSTVFSVRSDRDASQPVHTPLAHSHVVQWIETMLGAGSESATHSAKRALRAICVHSLANNLMSATIAGFCLPSAKSAVVSGMFFDVVSEAAMEAQNSFPQCRAIFLCLSNLVHPQVRSRERAFDWLVSVLSSLPEREPLLRVRSFVDSSSEGINLQGQRHAAEITARAFASQSTDFLAECAARLSQGYDGTPYLLAILLPWLGYIQFLPDEDPEHYSITIRAFSNLLSITAAHLEQYPDEIFALWQKLVCGQFPDNNRAIIRLGIIHALRCGREDYLRVIRAAVASQSGTDVSLDSFEYLCDLMGSNSMSFTDQDNILAGDLSQITDLDGLFPGTEDRFWLSSGQIACLLLTEIALVDKSEIAPRLPVILHAVLLLIDHELTAVRSAAQSILRGAVRMWKSDGPPGHSDLDGAAPKSALERLGVDGHPALRQLASERRPAELHALLEALCRDLLHLLEPSQPDLRQRWSELAIIWATATSSRQTATRSLQVFRMVTPNIEHHTMTLLLGRLSNTVSDPSDRVQTVAAEILRGLITLARSLNTADLPSYPQLFWTGFACLQSTVKQEFLYGVEILDTLFRLLDSSAAAVYSQWESSRPANWAKADSGLTSLLMIGLRSSYTSELTTSLLQRIAEFPDLPLLSGDGPLQCIFTVSLPRFLNAMNDKGDAEESQQQFALELAGLGETAGWQSMARVMTSFSKNRFRTREDFVRQAVGCLRERVSHDEWPVAITLLISLVLNSQRWLRINAMQILKLLFGIPEIRSHLQFLGSEHLMPLLRLLHTDLASQALEVLDEPVSVAGGLPAKQVVRMSLLNGPNPRQQNLRSVGTVFGVPDASGWCVAKPEETSAVCRVNMSAVYSTCNEASRVVSTSIASVIFTGDGPDLVDEASWGASPASAVDMTGSDSLGDLVSSLHDLSNYFEEDETGSQITPSSSTSSVKDAERRVAAILSRSLDKSTATPLIPLDGAKALPMRNSFEPPTPFIGLFNIASPATPRRDMDAFNQNFLDDSEEDGYFAEPDHSHPRNGAAWHQDANSDSDDDAASAIFGLDDVPQTSPSSTTQRMASSILSRFSPARNH